MGKFRDIDRSALFKQIPIEDVWIPRGHLARFVVEIVSQLNLSVFEQAYKGCGRKPYPPAMLLAMLIYGYLTGLFSSRKIEEATYDSIAFRFLAGNTHPDHSSLAGFRKRFQNEFKDIFFQVLVVAHEMGIVRMGRIAVDGTKIGANASKHSALSYGHAEKIEAQLKEEVRYSWPRAAKRTMRSRPRSPSIFLLKLHGGRTGWPASPQPRP